MLVNIFQRERRMPALSIGARFTIRFSCVRNDHYRVSRELYWTINQIPTVVNNKFNWVRQIVLIAAHTSLHLSRQPPIQC